MVKLYLVFYVITFALWVYALVNVITTKDEDARHLAKWVWILLVLFFPLIGSIAWLAVGAPRRPQPRAGERAVPHYPEYDRPGRATGVTPASDEEFLRKIRERAEEQRRKAAELRKAEQESEENREKPKDPPNPAL